MACNCTAYECLSVKFNPCSTGALSGLTAENTELWTMQVEFNGMWREYTFGVEAGEPVVIPTEALNEFYTHEVLFYAGGALINDTCYRIKSRSMVSAGTFSPIAPTTLAEILADIAALQNDVVALDEQVGDLQDADVGIIADIATIQGDITALQDADTEIFGRLDDIQAVIDRLSQDQGRAIKWFAFTVPFVPVPSSPWSVTSAQFAGKDIKTIMIGRQILNIDKDFTQTGNTIALTDPMESFNTGEILNMFYTTEQ